MASKKVFTSLEFQSGAKLLKAKIDPQAATDLSGADPTFGASAGQVAYGDDTNLYLGVGAEWKKLYRQGIGISTSSVLTSTLASNSGAAPPFVVASTDKVANLKAELLGSSDDALASGTHRISTSAAEHGIPVYGTNGVLPVGTPAADGDAATKAYVDTTAQGLTIKDPVYIATTAALPASTYANGTAGVGATLTANAAAVWTIDGKALLAGKRILVKNQASTPQNGIYTITTVGTGSVAAVLTRATDYDVAGDIKDGDFVFVEEGTDNANNGFVQTQNAWTANIATVGSTGIDWTQFSGAGQISVTSNGSASAPLTKSGDTIDFRYSLDNALSTTSAVDLLLNGTTWAAATGGTPPTSWTLGGGAAGLATFTVNGSELKIARASGGTNPYIYQTFDAVIGREYRVTYRAKKGTADAKVGIGNTAANVQYNGTNYTSTDWTSFDETYTATTEVFSVYLQTLTSSGTEDAYFDSVKVVEADALTVKSGGIDTLHLADDAVEPAKLDDDGEFTMGGLTVNGSIGLNTSSPDHAFQTDVTSGNANFIGIRQADYILWSTGLKASDTNLYFRSGNAGSETDHVTFGIDGQVGIGADATSPSGTLHVSTARYGSELVDAAASVFTSGVYNWSAAGGNSRANVGGALEITYVNSPGGAFNYLRNSSDLTTDLTVGRKYRLTADAKYAGGLSGVRLRVHDGVNNIYSSALTTSLVTYTIEFTAQSATGGYFQLDLMGANNVVTIDNWFLQEDTLASASWPTFEYADDLVVNNKDEAGLTILGGTDSRVHFGVSGNPAHTQLVSTFDGNKDSKLEFKATDDGTTNTVMTVFGLGEVANKGSVKIEGGLGIGMAATVPLNVKNTGNSAYAVHVKASATTSDLVGIYEEPDGRASMNVRNAAGTATVNLDSGGTSWFNGGNLAIGATSSTAKLTVNNSEGVADIRIFGSGNDAFVSFGDDTNNYAIGADETTNKFSIARQGDLNGSIKLSVDSDGSLDQEGNSIVNSSTVQGLQDGGACYDFDGTDDYISAGTSLWSANGDRTFSIWLKADDFATQHNIFHTEGVDASGDFMIHTDGTIRIHPATSNWQNTTSAISTGVWYHIVLTQTSSARKIYVDGVEQTLGSATGSPQTVAWNTPDGELRIGGEGNRDFFDGQIRDVKLFPSVLTAGDVRKLYSGENPKKNLNVELVTNGDFSSSLSTGWTVDSGTTAISGGECVSSNGNGVMHQSGLSVTTGKTYLLTLDYDVNDADSIRVAPTGVSLQVIASSGSGSYSLVFVGGGTNIHFYTYMGSGESCSIDNVSIVEVGTLVDFNSRSASSETWYNQAIPSLYNGDLQGGVTLSQGNTYWNNIKQVGGTATVDGLLETTGNVSITGSGGDVKLTLDRTDKRTYSLYTESNNDFRIKDEDASADRFSISSTGNTKVFGKLGVGGDPDGTAALNVVGSTKLGGDVILEGETRTLDVKLKTTPATGDMGVQFRAGSGDYLGFAAGGGTGIGIVLDDSNNVGIATESPVTPLEIYNSSTTGTAELQLSSVSSGDCAVSFIEQGDTSGSTNNKKFGQAAAYGFQWKLDGGENRLYLKSSNETTVKNALFIDRDTPDINQQGNRIVNSQTVSDLHRTAEPSLRFDGSNDYVSFGSTPPSLGTTYSLEVWIKPEVQGTNEAIVTYCPNGTERRVINIDASGVVAFGYYEGGSWTGVKTPATESGKWHHIVGTRSGSTQKIYLDGVLYVTATGTLYTNSGWGLGYDGNTSNSAFYKGEIKGHKVHNRVLDSDEVAASYSGNSTPFKYANMPPAAAGIAHGDSATTYPHAMWRGYDYYHERALGYSLTGSTIGVTSSSGGYWPGPGKRFSITGAGKKYRIQAKYTRNNGAALNGFYLAKNDVIIRDFDATSGLITNKGGSYAPANAYGSNDGGSTDGLHYISESASSGLTTIDYELDLSNVSTGTLDCNEIIFVFLSYDGTASPYISFDETTVRIQESDSGEAGGEVAAYTPRSISDKWYDETSNKNHGTIDGATVTGQNRLGSLNANGAYSTPAFTKSTATTNAVQNVLAIEADCTGTAANGFGPALVFRHTDALQGVQDYSILESYMDGAKSWNCGFRYRSYDSAWRTRLDIKNDGSVKATSAASDNLKQVARVHSKTMVVNTGTALAYTVTHNLGTKGIITSAQDSNNEFVDVHVDAATDDTAVFTFASASAVASDEDFIFTIMGGGAPEAA